MRIIISPAKKMKTDTDSLEWRSMPCFLSESKVLLDRLRSMSYDELKSLWKCNDKIAELNFERLKYMDLEEALTPAVLAYEGIQYQYMAPGVFTHEELEYIQEHLRILSGFYGILRPFDGISPYRLEMQAKLTTQYGKDLYEFWGKSLSDKLLSESDCIINLASKEYSICVSRYLRENTRFISCIFGEEKEGKIIEKGTMCKMARGEMLRFMAENNIKAVEELKKFDRLKYSYSAKYSDDKNFVFILDSKKGSA